MIDLAGHSTLLVVLMDKLLAVVDGIPPCWALERRAMARGIRVGLKPLED